MITATRSADCDSLSASAISPVGNGRNDTAISSSRFIRISTGSTARRRVKSPWWASHTPPIVRKLVK